MSRELRSLCQKELPDPEERVTEGKLIDLEGHNQMQNSCRCIKLHQHNGYQVPLTYQVVPPKHVIDVNVGFLVDI